MSFSGNLYPTASTDTGFDLTTKGQIHGYSTNQIAINVGSDNQLLVAEAADARGVSYQNNLQSINLISIGARVNTSKLKNFFLFTTNSTFSIRIPYWLVL